ncbi:MAG: hypothetical protein ABFD49_00085 [Armatimonadota bacterium]|nr:hypothetical protein [bacterium]
MKEDRLHKDTKEIHNPEDIIDAHDERTSHFAGEVDPYEGDVEVDEEIDVDEALTFPHPHRKKAEDINLMDTPHKNDTDEDWRWSDQDFQPEDYEHDYEEGISTRATDNIDEIVEEQVHEMGHMVTEDATDEETLEVMPNKFEPDEETKG